MTYPIINLTEYPATIDQLEAGVCDLSSDHRRRLADLLDMPGQGFGSLTHRERAAILHARAALIVKEFVDPVAIASMAALLNHEPCGDADDESCDLLSIDPACGRVRCMVGIGGFQPLITELVRQLCEQGHEPLYGRPVNLDTRYVKEVIGGLLPA